MARLLIIGFIWLGCAAAWAIQSKPDAGSGAAVEPTPRSREVSTERAGSSPAFRQAMKDVGPVAPTPRAPRPDLSGLDDELAGLQATWSLVAMGAFVATLLT